MLGRHALTSGYFKVNTATTQLTKLREEDGREDGFIGTLPRTGGSCVEERKKINWKIYLYSAKAAVAAAIV